MSLDDQKKRAALAALAFVSDGCVLGVGTGSTVNHFIDALGTSGISLRGAVSSSEASSIRLRAIGVEEVDLNHVDGLDVYIDGADECDRFGRLIKGGGAALTREKIVAAASKQFVCLIDDSKRVNVLGAFALPVEVIPMARSLVARQLVALGGRPQWRDGVVTDNGNVILDVHGLTILDPLQLETQINQLAGVVSVGLFAHRPADIVICNGERLTLGA